MEKYTPPFVLTDKIANLVIEISALVKSVDSSSMFESNPVLRRENRIKTIHSSLAIENNRLSLEQTTEVLNGKRVLGPPQDIKEVKNAYEAYEHLSQLNPYSIDDLLKAHKFMMNSLLVDAGKFRTGNVGVYDGDKLIHAGTPAKYVFEVVEQLFNWLKESKLHPLIKSCVFHYEFEFIHPFSDGNGRTGRLWQSLILQKWNPIFAWLPVETIIHEHQKEYYDAIAKADADSDSTFFIEFMLDTIKQTLQSFGTQDGTQDGTQAIIDLILANNKITTDEIAERLGISVRTVKRKIKENSKIKYIGHGYSGHWEIID